MVWVSAREGKETEVRSFKDREGISMRNVNTWIRYVVADIWGRKTGRRELRTKGSLAAGLTCWGGACESPSGFWEAVFQHKQKCTARAIFKHSVTVDICTKHCFRNKDYTSKILFLLECENPLYKDDQTVEIVLAASSSYEDKVIRDNLLEEVTFKLMLEE